MVEHILQDFDKAYGLKSIVFRYFNAAGADPSGRIGFHEPITHLIPQVLKAASGRKDGICVFGSDYDTRDGTCVRDYIHVNDIVKAHYLGYKRLISSNDSNTYNLGVGTGYSVNEVVNAVKLVTGAMFPVNYVGRRAGDPCALVADSSAAVNELNWRPRYSDLDRIIRDAWRWEQNPIWHKESEKTL